MRQPVDIDWFAPTQHPQQLLVLSNYMRGQRREILEGVCEELRLRCHPTGAHAAPAADPRPDILAVDIFVGYGRSILEAMACGRAAYVFDHNGGDGWVTLSATPLASCSLTAPRWVSPTAIWSSGCTAPTPTRTMWWRSCGDCPGAPGPLANHFANLPALPGGSGTPSLGWALMSENERLRSEVSRLHALADQHHAWGMGIFRTRRYRLGATLVRPLDALRNLAQKLRNR